jgi:hypothetical protein
VAKLRLRGTAANTTLLVLPGRLRPVSVRLPEKEAPQMAAILRVEHPVGDFQRRRQAFDGDPEDRARSGVCSYRIMRGREDPNYVLIDLEFKAPEPAEAFLARLRQPWNRVEVMRHPRARVVELVQERSLIAAAKRS